MKVELFLHLGSRGCTCLWCRCSSLASPAATLPYTKQPLFGLPMGPHVRRKGVLVGESHRLHRPGHGCSAGAKVEELPWVALLDPARCPAVAFLLSPRGRKSRFQADCGCLSVCEVPGTAGVTAYPTLLLEFPNSGQYQSISCLWWERQDCYIQNFRLHFRVISDKQKEANLLQCT